MLKYLRHRAQLSLKQNEIGQFLLESACRPHNTSNDLVVEITILHTGEILREFMGMLLPCGKWRFYVTIIGSSDNDLEKDNQKRPAINPTQLAEIGTPRRGLYLQNWQQYQVGSCPYQILFVGRSPGQLLLSWTHHSGMMANHSFHVYPLSPTCNIEIAW